MEYIRLINLVSVGVFGIILSASFCGSQLEQTQNSLNMQITQAFHNDRGGYSPGDTRVQKSVCAVVKRPGKCVTCKIKSSMDFTVDSARF